MNVKEERISTADIAGSAAAVPSPPRPAMNEPQAVRDISGSQPAMLFTEREAQELRGGWDRIQTGFVDEPRKAVEEADQLVAVTIKRLAESFARERSNLEKQWDKDTQVNTEDLRVALQRYRSFFQRLLAF